MQSHPFRYLFIASATLAAAGYATAANVAIMEGGVAPSVGNTYQTVNFQQTYGQAPVVLMLNPNTDPNPVITRIRNVTTTGFEIAQFETDNSHPSAPAAANDGNVVASNISYLAILPGVHTIGGLTFEAGKISTSAHQHGADGTFTGTESYVNQGFSHTFSALPTVITAVQTQNNAGIVMLSTAHNALTTSGGDFALELAEVNSGTPQVPGATQETIGYLAIDGGTGSLVDNSSATISFESILTTNDVNSLGEEGVNGRIVPFSGAGLGPNVIAVGSQAAIRGGGDGSWLQQASISATGVGVYAQEDQHNDVELGHGGSERAGIFAFSDSFAYDVVPEPSAFALFAVGLGTLLLRRRR